MSQSFTEDWFASTSDPEVGFGYAEENDNACMSNFSGTAAPGNTTQGLTWWKSSDAGSTVCGLRVRNSSDNAWHKVFHGTSACRLWMYRNDADAGWIIDSSVADVLISVKSSSTSGYGSTGGTSGGSWAITGLASSHRHRWIYSDSSGKSYSWPSSDGTAVTFDLTTKLLQQPTLAGQYYHISFDNSSGLQVVPRTSGIYTEYSSAGSTGDATWRPAAAIGTIQYPDLS